MASHDQIHDQIHAFKIVLIGNGGVGKAAFVKKLQQNEFERKYNATIGVEVHPVHFHTNKGFVQFNIWDCAGQEKFAGIRGDYFHEADGAILMCDVLTRVSAKTLGIQWYPHLKSVCGDNIPIVVCANKCEYPENEHKIKKVELGDNIPFYQISVKTDYNLYEPLLQLTREFLGNDVRFT